MRISTIREFRENAPDLLRSKTPVLVTRRGRPAGIFFPRPEVTLPMELKRELFQVFSREVARELKRKKLSEANILSDFEQFRHSKKAKNGTRRRR